jgi:hypothetical protein
MSEMGRDLTAEKDMKEGRAMRRRSAVTRTAAVVVSVGALTALSVAPAQATGSIQHLSTFLTGAQEVPGPGDGNGFGVFAAVTNERALCYVVTARRIEPATAAHIHAGPAGVAGGIVVGLRAPSTGLAAACIKAVPDDQNSTETLTVSELAAIRADASQFYVNVHNAPFPAGAIRGQLH